MTEDPGGTTEAPLSARDSEIAELIEETHRVLTAHERLRALMTASSVVAEELDLEQVLRHIVTTAVSLVDAQYGALGIIDAGSRLERFIHVGMPVEVAERIGNLPEGHGLLGAGIYGDGPIRLQDLSTDPRSVGFPAHHPPMSTFLAVPIRIHGEDYGNLYLTNRAGGNFTVEDEELVTALAATAATAINNARRYQSARSAQKMSATLAEVSGLLLASAGRDAFGVVVDHVTDLIDADLTSVVVPGALKEDFTVQTARGEGALMAEGMTLPARSLRRGDDADRTPRIPGEPPFREPLEGCTTIAVPLIIADQQVGFLCATRKAPAARFSASDLVTLTEFAEQTGTTVALAWARADRQRLDLLEDRARTARDLHDHVIQRLFGAGLGLQALATMAPSHAEAIDQHVTQIDAAIADIRTAIFTLSVQDSSESARHRVLNVVAELTPVLSFAPRVSFTGPVDLVVVGSLADDAVAVVRESLSNVARHAHAGSVEVSLDATGSMVTVEILDDGVGMREGAGRASGTANLRTRALAHGGEFRLEDREGGGALASWQVPHPHLQEVAS